MYLLDIAANKRKPRLLLLLWTKLYYESSLFIAKILLSLCWLGRTLLRPSLAPTEDSSDDDDKQCHLGFYLAAFIVGSSIMIILLYAMTQFR